MDILEKFQEYHSNHYEQGFKRLNINDQYNENKLTYSFQDNDKENINKNYYKDNFNNKELMICSNKIKDMYNNINQDFLSIQKRNLNNYEIQHRYCLGINIDFSLNKSICYHKLQKWFAYIFDNKIIIEDFGDEEFRKQIFLEDSKYKLSGLKLSPNNNYLIAFSTNAFLVEKRKDKEFDFSDLTSYNVFEEESLNNNAVSKDNNKVTVNIKVNPYIFIWDCKEFSEENQVPVFKNITKLSIKHNRIQDCEFSPQNNLCVFSSQKKNLNAINNY